MKSPDLRDFGLNPRLCAKVQAALLVRLLEDDAAEAKRILSEGRQDYPTIAEYLAQIDALCIDKQAVVYDDERGAQITF